MKETESEELRYEIVQVHKSIACLTPVIVVLYSLVGGLPVELTLLSSAATLSAMSALALATIAALTYGLIDTCEAPYNTDR